jgi:hypothetical protein
VSENSVQSAPVGSGSPDQHLDEELARRLAVLESPDFADPARRDLPAADYIGLLVANLALILVFVLWMAR